MTDRSDARLLGAWHGGDSAAFTEIVERYQGPLLRHARGLLGAGSPFEDVVQEVFLKLARERLVLPSGDPDGHPGGNAEGEGRQLSAWLHTVTRNACMDIIRSEGRRRRREREVASPETTRGGSHVIDAQDTRAIVEQEIAKLPIDQRDVLVLRLFAEHSYREIAEVTGKKVGTVGWLISQGLKTLSGNLAPVLQAEIGTRPEGPMGLA